MGTVTAAAAKVAAEVPPDVLTGGTVAETGPRPDFSLWTVEDDLLLKNAMEVLDSHLIVSWFPSSRFGANSNVLLLFWNDWISRLFM